MSDRLDSAYAAFSAPNFDANEYANSILAGDITPNYSSRNKAVTGETSTPALGATGSLDSTKEDISVAISKLNSGIEDVSKQLRNVVTTHHESFLVQAAGVKQLETSLDSVRSGLDDITSSLDKLRLKIHIPYQNLERQVTRLEKLQLASDILRRTARFVILARRLEHQMKEIQAADTKQENVISPSSRTDSKTSVKGQINPSTVGSASNSRSGTPATHDDLSSNEGEKERAVAKAALSIAELSSLLENSQTSKTNEDIGPNDLTGDSISLHSVNIVSAQIPTIDSAREKVTSEMEIMVITGLANLNQPLLASSLQTSYNLGVLPELVRSLVADLTDAVEERIRQAFDLAALSRDAGVKEQPPQSHGLLYKSRVRTEPTNTTAPQWTAALWGRLENLVEEMAGCCIKVYTLEKVLKLKKDTVTHLNFLDEAMKLLENKPSSTFWTILAKALEKQCRDTAKGSSFLSITLSNNYPKLLRLFQDLFTKVAVHTDTVYTAEKQSPETLLVLRALSNFETLYLSRSQIRLNEVVAQSVAAGARSPPGMGEGIGIARAIAAELEAAKFDPLFVNVVAKNVDKCLELFLGRIDGLVSRDRAATSLTGSTSHPSLSSNAQIATCLFHCWSKLDKMSEIPTSARAIYSTSLNSLRAAFNTIVEPLLAAIRRELNSIIGRLHRVDLGQGLDAAGALGGGPSSYMKELVDKLAFIKNEVIAKFNVGEESHEWIKNIANDSLRTFVLHASIARPLGESGKLQLTSDMTEFEFALNAFMTDGKQKVELTGDTYKALRSMRPMLFLDNAMLASPERTSGLPPLIVLHHILVRSPMPLPHALHGWPEAGYVRWVEEHTEEEALSLVEGVLSHWEKVHDTPSPELESSKEYIKLARTVLANSQK